MTLIRLGVSYHEAVDASRRVMMRVIQHDEE